MAAALHRRINKCRLQSGNCRFRNEQGKQRAKETELSGIFWSHIAEQL